MDVHGSPVFEPIWPKMVSDLMVECGIITRRISVTSGREQTVTQPSPNVHSDFTFWRTDEAGAYS